jgi:hypothetical protein
MDRFSEESAADLARSYHADRDDWNDRVEDEQVASAVFAVHAARGLEAIEAAFGGVEARANRALRGFMAREVA